MRNNVIVGNWKLNKSVAESVEFAVALSNELKTVPANTIVGIAPTYLALSKVIDAAGDSPVLVGAQDGYPEPEGAFTGKVSMSMIKQDGSDFCIIGHSEQRQYFGETDESVNLKVKTALDLELTPIMCVGETLEEREGGSMESVLRTQITEGLKGLNIASGDKIVLAYEPVWAIGTGKTATSEVAQETQAFCRSVLADVLGADLAEAISIQYGGSAKPENARELLDQKDIDGLLIGGAALKLDSFIAIVNC